MCNFCGIIYQSKLLLGLHSLRHQQAECPLASTDSCSNFQSDIKLISHFKETHQGDYKSLINVVKHYDAEEVSLDNLLQRFARDKAWINLDDEGLDMQNWTSKITLKQDAEVILSVKSFQFLHIYQLQEFAASSEITH